MTAMLKFARELADFESHLEWMVQRSDCGSGCDGTVAVSYLALIAELAELDEYVSMLEDLADDKGRSGRVAGILAGAIEVFRKAEAEATLHEHSRQARQRAEYDEAMRRHQLAVTVECPYCGAAPGATCRTAGPTGTSQPKGVHDHSGRYRLATAGTP